MINRALACLLMLSMLVITSAAEPRHAFSMEIPADSVKSISFNVQEGEFILRGDPNATAVRMNLSIDRFFIFRLGERDILQKLIKVKHNGPENLSISTDIPHSITNWGRAQHPIDFEVVLPARMDVQLHDTSGVIEISDLRGDVEIEDGSGTLSITRLGGNLRVQKSSGDVKVMQVKGKTQINSRSGQMRLENLGAVDILGSEGNLYVANIDSAHIRNGSGNLQIVGVKGAVVLEDSSGEIVVRNVTGAVDITDTSGQIRTSGTGPLTIHDTDGNITVDGAPSLRVAEKESGEIVVRNVFGPIDVPANIKVKRKS